MSRRDELLSRIRDAAPDEPLDFLVADLDHLRSDDLEGGVAVQPCVKIEGNWIQTALDGTLMRGESTPILAQIDEEHWRKYWPLPLGIEDYLGLVREAVEQRQKTRGDVELLESIAEDTVVAVRYLIPIDETNLRAAFERARVVQMEIAEVAEAVTAGIEDTVLAAQRRLRGWGSDELEALVDRMREGTSHEKGLALEELVSRLFNTVPGFSATGRVKTETEEIDIRIQNESEHPVWRRESALLIAECKNWSARCGKNEFVLFRSKLENRTGRVNCGFLVSWNGFAETVTAEMLRGTKGDLLIVPIDGGDLRAAVREGDFPERLLDLRTEAVLL